MKSWAALRKTSVGPAHPNLRQIQYLARAVSCKTRRYPFDKNAISG
jgi:hypothetical protein